MTVKATKEEKPTLLGARVYKKHRTMLAALEKKLKIKRAEVMRQSIEELYVRIFPAS